MQIGFDDKDNIIYVIDTSGLIKLESTFPKDNITFHAIWEEIEDLLLKSQFITIDFVESEINDYEGDRDFLKKWIKRWKSRFVFATNEEVINAAIPIVNEEYNTGFFDSKKQAIGKDEADPYLIAYCKVNNCTLITNENKNKPNKMPKVSEKNGVKCIDIYDFLIERELKMERKKR
ncbi:MAG: DUF4411 family protein [Desulfobacula sp.]|nr:DUF4411 family protein [Desulfobacula sp.]